MTPDVHDLKQATSCAVVWLAFWLIDRRTAPFHAGTLWFWACFSGAYAVLSQFAWAWPVAAIMHAAFAGWCAYKAWKRRKPRQRKPSKVAGMVRDLGHRLAVTSS